MMMVMVMMATMMMMLQLERAELPGALPSGGGSWVNTVWWERLA